MNWKTGWHLLFVALLLIVVGCTAQEGAPASTQPSTNSSPQSAQQPSASFPAKDITLIVPYAPGGSTDNFARVIAAEVSNNLPNNVQIIVENREGGSSAVGLTHLYNAEPDGYTVAIVLETGVAILPHTTELQYEWDKFTFLLSLAAVPNIMYVKADAPWANMEEWVEDVKNNPGTFKYAIAGVGTVAHLIMEEIGYKLGLEMVAVPYDSGGRNMQALYSGEVDGAIGAPPHLDPAVNRILFDTAPERDKLLDAPVLSEVLGPGIGHKSWMGLIAPPGLPDDIAQILHDAFRKTLEDPAMIEKLNQMGTPPLYAGPEQFKEMIQERNEINPEILKNIGMLK